MQLRHGCRNRTPWWCWIVMSGLAIATLPGAAWVTADEEQAHPLTPNWRQADSPRATPQDLHAAPSQPLPLAHLPCPPTTPLGPLVTREYDVTEILAKTCDELGCRKPEARRRIANEITAAGRTDWATAGVDVDMNESGQPQFNEGHHDPAKPELRFRGSTFTVRHDEQGHQRIANALERIRRLGYAQLRVEVRFISTRPEAVAQAVASWRLAPAEIPETDMPGMNAVDLNAWAAEAKQQQANRSVSSIEQFQPFQFQIVDNVQFTQILKAMQADAGTNLLLAPKITVFNGQTAMIQDSSQRPFVVGMKGTQPQIRVISEGVKLKLKSELLPVQPVEQESGDVATVSHVTDCPSVRLDFELVRSEILDVTTTTINVTGQADPITLQVPRVQSSRVESAVVAPLDQTLIIGGLQNRDENGQARSLLVAMTVRRVEPESPRQLFGVGVDSDAGVSGEIVVDERSFEEDTDIAATADEEASEGPITVRIYNVADLVVPLPNDPVICLDGKHDSLSNQDGLQQPTVTNADLETLIRLIQSTVAPASWESAGGTGAVRSFPAKLSLMVSQTPSVHAEIVDLLEQRRRTQEVQVTLEMRVIGLPDAAFKGETPDYSWELDDIPVNDENGLAKDGHSILTDTEMFLLMQALRQESQARIFAPKVTFFDGQMATLRLGNQQSPYTLLLQPVTSDDRKSIQLSYSAGRDVKGASLPEDACSLNLVEGQTLLLDTRGELQAAEFGWSNTAGIPMFPKLEKIPYVSRLFKSTPRPNITKIFVAVTPRIIIQDEEEMSLTED